jgi:zona occludens toxin
MVNADRRQNVFTNKKLWGMLALLIIGAVVCFWNVWKFFHPGELGKDGKPLKTPPTASAPVSGTSGAALSVSSPAAPVVRFSEVWRLSGSFYARGQSWVVMVNQAGAVRLASPSEFHSVGLVQIGDVDGAKVTSWSGGATRAAGFTSPSPVASAAPGPSAFEVRK